MIFAITGEHGDIGKRILQLGEEKGVLFKSLAKCKEGEVNTLVHLAAKSPSSTTEQIIDSNIDLLVDIIKQAKELNIKNVIFFSSMSIYGNQNLFNLDETTACIESSLYGRSKYMGEKIFEDSFLNVLSLRLPAILANKNALGLPSRLYQMIKNGDKIELINADLPYNNFIDVESLFNFIVNNEVKSGKDIVNLATKQDITLYEMCLIFKKVLNSSSIIECLDKKQNFFNISTEKANKKYKFNPPSGKNILKKWLSSN